MYGIKSNGFSAYFHLRCQAAFHDIVSMAFQGLGNIELNRGEIGKEIVSQAQPI